MPAKMQKRPAGNCAKVQKAASNAKTLAGPHEFGLKKPAGAGAEALVPAEGTSSLRMQYLQGTSNKGSGLGGSNKGYGLDKPVPAEEILGNEKVCSYSGGPMPQSSLNWLRSKHYFETCEMQRLESLPHFEAIRGTLESWYSANPGNWHFGRDDEYWHYVPEGEARDFLSQRKLTNRMIAKSLDEADDAL